MLLHQFVSRLVAVGIRKVHSTSLDVVEESEEPTLMSTFESGSVTNPERERRKTEGF